MLVKSSRKKMSQSRIIDHVPNNIIALSKQASDEDWLQSIHRHDLDVYEHFAESYVVDKRLTRQLVSFQANKKRSCYRWYKYKEAFSADLVAYLLEKYAPPKGKILDPFSGAGTALFAASDLGFESEGIELLPIGQEITAANLSLRGQGQKEILKVINRWIQDKPWENAGDTITLNSLRITDGAYPPKTEYSLCRYLHDIQRESTAAQTILRFALLCILESISYTRKDGQYLRWDHRSGRRPGKSTFDKGKILTFEEAIILKLQQIKDDISKDPEPTLFPEAMPTITGGSVKLMNGSCLDILPRQKRRSYSAIITSPPYCNRYDYTRTYALELALLGIQEKELVALRQAMLSCTVENKKKSLLETQPAWKLPTDICDDFPLLQELLKYLEYKKELKELNNTGISRMVRGYFYETACVIFECYRVLKKHGYMYMVNDNVRYAGASVSVDSILSKIAEEIGFSVERILVLPQGKGNSSQQMGHHGREPLRKCVYVWKKVA